MSRDLELTLDEAIKLAGNSKVKLAAVFDPPITKQAISAWDGRIPTLRLYQLKELRPEWFDPVLRGKKRGVRNADGDPIKP